MKRLLLIAVLLVSALSFGQGTVSHIRYGGTLPAACSATDGEIFFKTTSTVGLYACTATNTWALAGSGSGSGVTSIDGQTGAFTYSGSGVSHSGNAYTFSGGGGTSLFSGLITVPTTTSLGFTTAMNQSGSYSQTNVATGVAFVDSNLAGSENVEGAMKAYPGTPFTATGLFSLPLYTAATPLAGFCAATSLTGKIWFEGARANSAYENFNMAGIAYNNPTTYGGTLFVYTTGVSGHVWIRYKDDGTNIYLYGSNDGAAFQQFFSVAKSTSFLGSSGYNYFGVCIDTLGAPVETVLESYTLTTP